MAVPEQIRKQSEDIQKLYAQMNGAGNTDDDDDAIVIDDKPDEVEPVAKADDNSNSADDDAASDVVSEHDNNDDDETYAQKYRTLQGMFNSQVPALKAEKDQLAQKVSNLEELIANMKQEPASTPEPAPQETVQKLVTQAEIEEYGESIDVMRKVTQEEMGAFNSRIKALESKIDSLASNLNDSIVPQVHSVTQQYQKNTSENFWARLNQMVPDWQQTNNNPDFHTWLLEVDPLTGETRQRHLEVAQDKFDADRVAAFFNAFSNLSGKANDTNAQSSRSASELEKQVAPGRSRGTSPNTGSSEAKTYDRSFVEKFYSDVQKGRYKGKEKERDRIERDIFSALQDGRIVPN